MSRFLIHDGRLVVRDGRFVLARDGEPCICCAPPPPPGEWVRGVPCDCTIPTQPEAWIRAGDLAVLRSMGTCPTGRLPDGSCWEILRGAETRAFNPPVEQQLAPSGVDGCCVCCPTCEKVTLDYRKKVSCGPPTKTPREFCCDTGQVPVSGGFAEIINYVTTVGSGTCGPPGVGILRHRRAWWTCNDAGCRGVLQNQEWTAAGPTIGCRLDRDDVFEYEDPRRVDGCQWSYIYPIINGASLFWEVVGPATPASEIPGLFGINPCFPAPCQTPSLFLSETPTSIRWNHHVYPTSSVTPCVRHSTRRGYIFRQPVPAASSCKSRCIVTVLAPSIPPIPGGGNSRVRQTKSGLLVPDRTIISHDAGCSGCGANDDDAI